jgi:hypothetical protein
MVGCGTYATSQNAASSNPNEVNAFSLNLSAPSSHTLALGLK